MSKINIQKTSEQPNFLASERSLVLKTYQISDNGVTADENGNKTVGAGKIYPTNDANAVGVLFQDIDVTWGPQEGSLIMAGHVYSNRLPEAPNTAAIDALKNKGLYFHEAPETSRG